MRETSSFGGERDRGWREPRRRGEDPARPRRGGVRDLLRRGEDGERSRRRENREVDLERLLPGDEMDLSLRREPLDLPRLEMDRDRVLLGDDPDLPRRREDLHFPLLEGELDRPRLVGPLGLSGDDPERLLLGDAPSVSRGLGDEPDLPRLGVDLDFS